MTASHPIPSILKAKTVGRLGALPVAVFPHRHGGLQGFAGGVLIPLAFTIVMTMLPPAKRAIGLAGFAVTATFAPAIGPTIGGYLTDYYGWPWVFYVNLVPGLVMMAALCFTLPMSASHHTSRILRSRSRYRPGPLQTLNRVGASEYWNDLVAKAVCGVNVVRPSAADFDATISTRRLQDAASPRFTRQRTRSIEHRRTNCAATAMPIC